MMHKKEKIVAHSLEIAVTTSNLDAVQTLGEQLGGVAYVDARAGAKALPFRALVTGVTDNPEGLVPHADIGQYVVCRRVIKPGSANYYGLFPLIHHPDKTHALADGHWRDTHGPLALEHHIHMTHYVQLAVVHHISGPPINGFALCGFNTEDDLRNRFYTTNKSIEVIADDVAKFADIKASPRRLIAQPLFFH